MLLKPVPLVFRKHSRPTRRPPRVAPPVGLQVIAVEDVLYDEPVLSFTLVFNTSEDEPLVADTLDPAKWSAAYQGGGFAGLSADVVAFDRIAISLQGTAGPGGASSVSYAADPSDVSDTLGRMLAAFSDFPF